MIGGDGKEYGPYTAEEVQTWIGEGRIGPDTQVAKTGGEGWRRAGDEGFTWPALPVRQPSPQPPPPKPGVRGGSAVSLHGVRSAASWVFIIAALSMINVVLQVRGANLTFAVGCLAVEFAAGMAEAAGGTVAGVAVGAVGAGLWVGLGLAARGGRPWAFLLAMGLFALDMLLLLLAFSPISLALHAYVIYRLWGGFAESRAVQRALRG